MSKLENNRISKIFAERTAAGKKTLLPFITSGYPDIETTEALLHDFESRGCLICELGIPFSDPVADGPVIQASYTEALAGGVTSDKIFDMVRKYRSNGGQMALLAMVSYSIVYRHGVAEYLSAAAEVGIDGFIIPDLSLEEAAKVEQLTAERNLCNVMLIAPNTPPQRRLTIAGHSSGFIYFMSIAGITGERAKLPESTIEAVAELRTHIDTPVVVGFGISNAEMVETVCKVADGAIVGSAIVHKITDSKNAPRETLVKSVGDFVAELLSQIK